MITTFLTRIDLTTIIVFFISYFIFGIVTFETLCLLTHADLPDDGKFDTKDVIVVIVLWPIIAIIMLATSVLLFLEWLPRKIRRFVKKLLKRK